jgi:hypothetical protein
MERPSEYSLDSALQHRHLHFVVTPLPESRIPSPMSFDEVACDDRMPVEAARQGRDTHPIIDPELQRLHALPNVRALPFPALHVCVVSEAANQSERVVDVTIAVRFDQCTVLGKSRGDSNLLRPPIEVDADRVGRERHERADVSRAH